MTSRLVTEQKLLHYSYSRCYGRVSSESRTSEARHKYENISAVKLSRKDIPRFYGTWGLGSIYHVHRSPPLDHCLL
jgi:hypothetical protein